MSFVTAPILINHSYTLNSTQNFTVPASGNYQIEVVGGGGGDGWWWWNTSKTYYTYGGVGGYAKKTIYLTKDSTILCTVGGAGSSGGAPQLPGGSGNCNHAYITGGGTSSFSFYLSATGGGAASIGSANIWTSDGEGGYFKEQTCGQANGSPGTGVGGDVNSAGPALGYGS